MGCGVQKNFIENIKMLTEFPAFKSSDDSEMDTYKNSLLTVYPKKPWEPHLLTTDQWGNPGLNGRKV